MSDTESTNLSFSQRMGLAPATKVVQINSIDTELRNSLWNVTTQFYWSNVRHPARQDRVSGSNAHLLAISIYADFLKLPTDDIPYSWSLLKNDIKTRFFKMEWHQAYSFIEYLVGFDWGGTGKSSAEKFNEILKRENSAYRFVSGKLMRITDENEVAEIEWAIQNSEPYAGVKPHLLTSLSFLTNREQPDYRNSIKESISAVRSLARHLTGNPKAMLGQALSVLEKNTSYIQH